MTHDCTFLEALDLAEDQVAFAESTRGTHAGDWGTREADQVVPDTVVYPESTADVSAVLAAADERGVPVTPYAAGTGLEGNATPVAGGVSLDMTRMDDVSITPDDLQVEVEAGAMGSAIRDAAGEYGLFFPPLPSSGDISTVGGMLANDAGGMQTVKYGEVHDWLVNLEAVLADGTVLEPGTRAIKTSAGYNLQDLIVGSEGTLAVVTRATFELAGIPEQIRGGRALFSTLGDAADAVFDAVTAGVDVAKIELVDADSARMANAYSGTDLPDVPMVFLEFHANHGVEAEIDFCRDIFEAHGVERFEIGADEEMDRLWAARRDLAYAVQSYDPDLEPLHPGDVTVPISEYPTIIRYAKELGEREDLLVPCFGHAGDGNCHYAVLVDPEDDDERERGEAVSDAIVRKAIELGGTSTGEHGIGLGKRQYLELERGPGAVDAMRTVKRALDPNGTLNPGKIFPETI